MHNVRSAGLFLFIRSELADRINNLQHSFFRSRTERLPVQDSACSPVLLQARRVYSHRG